MSAGRRRRRRRNKRLDNATHERESDAAAGTRRFRRPANLSNFVTSAVAASRPPARCARSSNSGADRRAAPRRANAWHFIDVAVNFLKRRVCAHAGTHRITAPTSTLHAASRERWIPRRASRRRPVVVVVVAECDGPDGAVRQLERVSLECVKAEQTDMERPSVSDSSAPPGHTAFQSIGRLASRWIRQLRRIFEAQNGSSYRNGII